MSSFLYDLGRSCFHRRRSVVAVWAVLLAVILGSVALFAQSFEDDFELPGSEAQEALDSLALTFPEVSGASGQVIVVAADGDSIEEAPYRERIDDAVDDFGELDHVESATSPFAEAVEGTISDAGSAALISLQYDESVENLPDTTQADLESAVDALIADLPAGSEGSPGGELFNATGVHLSIVEVIGVIVAFVVLLVTLGSLRAAGMPLISALLSVAIGLLLVVLATAFFTVNSTTPMLALMLGLAVGIDYALFIVSRHRAFLEEGLPADEAAARANATSGSAVVFAGVTVMVALTGLSVAGIPFLAVMGIAAAVTVAIAVAVSLTLLPALLGFAGDRIRPSQKKAAAAPVGAAPVAPRPSLAHRFYSGWVRAAIRVPALTIAIIVVGLGLFMIPASQLQLALPNGGGAEEGTPQKVSYDLIADEFGEGFNGPLVVTADIISSDDPVGDIEAMGEDIEAVEGVEQVVMATPNRSADTGIIQVIPTTAPDAPETEATVERIRALEPQLLDEYGHQIAVTGATALAIDISAQLGGALLPFGIFVVGFSLLLLMVVFRSIVVPIKATVGFLLSVITAFGVVVLVFHEGVFAGPLGITDTGPVISFLPIILMGILFGLAMDYEVFLVTGMREAYVHGADARTAIVRGFTTSAKVVTAAAVIMIAVFGAFVPTGEPIIKSIALGLAVGVFTDAFLIRMTLVPAVLALLGDRAWALPRWLDRLLPKVDVEGEGLVHQVALRDWPHADAAYAAYGEGLTLEHADSAPVYADLDVAVAPGDVLAVSGHGSSALLLTLSGRIVPDHGTLKVAGLVVPEENRKIRREVPFLTLDSPDAGLMVDAAAMRQMAKNPPALLVLDHADRAHDRETAAATEALVRAAVENGSAVVLGLVDQRADWMIPSQVLCTQLDLEADRLAAHSTGGTH
ncbi:MMPL family transporter [Brevibacterium jeotgali]|uniref:Putative drug exporter of the RND superfamily n=1 Tax=Brevibacterium jeotgali TaxID=1262550 RepID=A0A2H1L1D9_9MICO|nr:MMPL family transporter [Brevibacterium jeotgali]TWC01932.1 RND superfamily putative drug exporter [Brevibacterium jeotgali]SMY10717.1 putative drug exporter of the RND superfamily [Brevibacterium jeotgali]